jgi:hypothetical protein
MSNRVFQLQQQRQCMSTGLQFLNAHPIRLSGIKWTIVSAVLIFADTLSGASPTPSFLARRDYYGLSPSNWMQVADTNQDGIPDLIDGELGYIQVFLGSGNGTFALHGVVSQSIVAANSFIAADVDGDGETDLVLAGISGPQSMNGIGVCKGNGDGTFQPGTFYAVPDSGPNKIWHLVVGDFNGDGIADIAAAGASGIWFFAGEGAGEFKPGVLAVSISAGTGLLATTDFNADSKLDLVVTLGTGGFAVLLGNGDGTFESPKIFAKPNYVSGLAAGNLSKNGYPGIAVASGSYFYLFEGNGEGGFSQAHYVSLPQSSEIALGDVNGDGIPDLVSASGYVALGTASGSFKAAVYYPVVNVENQFHNVVLVDLRKNGLMDIVTDDAYGISVLLNSGKSKFEDGEWFPVLGGAGCGAVGNFNGDGRPDLAVTTSTGFAAVIFAACERDRPSHGKA